MLYYNIVPIYVIGAGLANLGKKPSYVDAATFHEKHSFFIKIMLYDFCGGYAQQNLCPTIFVIKSRVPLPKYVE